MLRSIRGEGHGAPLSADAVACSPSRYELMSVRILLIVWCALCLALIIGNASSREFWYDEMLTFHRVQLSFRKLSATVYGQGHSPLYFVLLKLFVQLTGGSLAPGRAEVILRLPSALLMTGAGALLIHTLLRLGRSGAALVLALLWLSWPMLLFYGNEARPYALLMLFAALAISGTLLSLAAGGGKGALWASAVGSVGMALTIPLGLVGAGALEIAALLAFSSHRNPAWWQRSRVVWLLLGLALLVYLPPVMEKAANYWTERRDITQLSFHNLAHVLLGVFSPNGSYGPDSVEEPLLPPLLAFLPLGALALYVLIPQLRRRMPGGPTARFFLFGMLAIPAVLCLASLKTSVLVNRYFLPTLCFSLPLYACWIAGQSTRLGRLLAMLSLASVFVAGWAFLTKPAENNFAEIKSILKHHGIQREVFFVDNFVYIPSMRFYLRDVIADLYYERKADEPPMPAARAGRPDQAVVFWMIQSRRSFDAIGGHIQWAARERQCSIALPTYVATLVVPDPAMLKPFADECIKTDDAVAQPRAA